MVAQSDVETKYVGDPIVDLDFIITLDGVPAGTHMNALQKRYFEIITASFLNGVAKNVPIYTATVVDEVGDDGAEGRRRRRLPSSRFNMTRAM